MEAAWSVPVPLTPREPGRNDSANRPREREIGWDLPDAEQKRWLWSTITSQWKQYLAYAVVGFVLTDVGAILVGIVIVILAVILLVPFGIFAAVGVGTLFVFEPLGIGLLAVIGILYGLSVVAVAAVVQVSVQTYLRYYALLILRSMIINARGLSWAMDPTFFESRNEFRT
ncbi:DUF7544 domain-containing protein [Halococcus hamelinensis]|uniref:Uncharacterized protein n=1 Tax=Halococcus hamelinensis 100A6 TaxID=1132509 RepID=M0LWB0_9EURY|nr:hypothetical protein [Halococcus hamelinensis]EMA37756.1 hypothetical protein C447_12310 [Halococcus hamelinensis 100A6]